MIIYFSIAGPQDRGQLLKTDHLGQDMHPLRQQFFDRFLPNVGVYITDADIFIRTAYTDQFFAGKLGRQQLFYL
jgi:hypothetical protein